jgi:hypothetical protein
MLRFGAFVCLMSAGARATLDCDTYRKTTTCDWTDKWACPPNQGTHGQASKDGSDGWTCCCSCGGSIDTAASLAQAASDAAGRAAKSCLTFNNQCVTDGNALSDAFFKAMKFAQATVATCQYQVQQCLGDASSVVSTISGAIPHVNDLVSHCVNGQNPGDFFWCAGDITHVTGDMLNIIEAINTARYDCGFGEACSKDSVALKSHRKLNQTMPLMRDVQPNTSSLSIPATAWRTAQPNVSSSIGPLADFDCDTYRRTTTCDWTEQYACPPNRGTKGQASDDGSEGWNCCCTCGGSIGTAGALMQQAADAAGQATESCATFSGQCVTDTSNAYNAFSKAVKYSQTSAFVCKGRVQQCLNDAASVISLMDCATPHLVNLNDHCVHGKNAGDYWWCAGDVAHVSGDAWNIKAAVDTTLYHCGFGGAHDTLGNQSAMTKPDIQAFVSV